MKRILSAVLLSTSLIGLGWQKGAGQGGTPQQDAERERGYQESIRRTHDEESRLFRPVPSLPRGNKILSTEDRAKLKPRDEDLAQYSQFLKQSKTGIFKIFPFFNCDRRIINVNDEKCLNAPQLFGNGSFYSFEGNTHLFSTWSEIKFADGSLSIHPSPGLLGIIKELGDVSLDILDKSSPQLSEIRNFQPPTGADEVYGKRRFLTHKAPVKVGNTYAVRLMHFSKTTFYRFERNDRTDRLLLLRIIRQETDESLTIIWKEIEKKKTPKLKR